MGLKIWPSTPCMVNKGTNAATVIMAEKKIAMSTCSALAKSGAADRSRGQRASNLPICVGSGQTASSASCCSSDWRSVGLLEIPENVLDQDHRRIDDDAEIDGADRKQVGVLPHHHHDDDGEKQRERNIDADDDGAAQVAEENPLDDEDQERSRRSGCAAPCAW
jgi:hypothetical protein